MLSISFYNKQVFLVFSNTHVYFVVGTTHVSKLASFQYNDVKITYVTNKQVRMNS